MSNFAVAGLVSDHFGPLGPAEFLAGFLNQQISGRLQRM